MAYTFLLFDLDHTLLDFESAGLSYLDFLVAFSLDWLKLYDAPSAFAWLAGGNTQYQFL